MKMYFIDGRKVWLDPATAPANAIPMEKTKTEQPKPEPVPEETSEKARKTPANKARKAGGNK